jgi:hypothetical protein
MPSFHRFPDEAAILGRLLAGYGEIEFILGLCADHALKGQHAGLRALFRLRSESNRLEVADAILRPLASEIDLLPKYETALAAIKHCKKIRNQYAHCHWADHETAGLFFTNVEVQAGKPKSRS